jgi:hypothetical protein
VRPAKLLSPFSEALSFRLQFRKILALYGHCYSKRDEAAPSTVGPASFNYLITMEKNGADDPTRTDDLLITSELLYQLSYVGPGGELRLSLRQPSLAKSAIAHRWAARVSDACLESDPRFSRGSVNRAAIRWGRRPLGSPGAECSAGPSRRHRTLRGSVNYGRICSMSLEGFDRAGFRRLGSGQPREGVS